MRYALSLFVVLCLLASGRSADDKEEYKAFQGTWTVEKFFIGGKEQGKGDTSTATFQFSADMAKMITVEKDGESSAVEFKHELRPSKKPADKPSEINLFANSPVSNLVLKGIYKLDGDDLTICVVAGTMDRPTELKTQKDDGAILFVLKRKK